MTNTLYASSGTLDGIKTCITRFYCDTPITLTPKENAPAELVVSNSRGPITTVRVI